MNRRRFHHRLAAAGVLLALAACSKTESPPAAAPAAPAAAALTPREAFELAQTGHGFTVGVPMAANTVYVFFDTTCPHCAELWKASQPLLPKLKMVWMPIGLLRASSGPQGATILAAADPVAAMAENEVSVLARGGGISAAANLSDEVLAKVKTNTELFRKIGSDSVPLIVYRNARTGSPGVHPGAVDTAGLAALVGL